MGRRSRAKRAYAKALMNPNDRRRQIAVAVEPGSEMHPRSLERGPSVPYRTRRWITRFFAKFGGGT